MATEARVSRLEELVLPPPRVVVLWQIPDQPGVFTRTNGGHDIVSAQEIAALQEDERVSCIKVVYDDAQEEW